MHLSWLSSLRFVHFYPRLVIFTNFIAPITCIYKRMNAQINKSIIFALIKHVKVESNTCMLRPCVFSCVVTPFIKSTSRASRCQSASSLIKSAPTLPNALQWKMKRQMFALQYSTSVLLSLPLNDTSLCIFLSYLKIYYSYWHIRENCASFYDSRSYLRSKRRVAQVHKLLRSTFIDIVKY